MANPWPTSTDDAGYGSLPWGECTWLVTRESRGAGTHRRIDCEWLPLELPRRLGTGIAGAGLRGEDALSQEDALVTAPACGRTAETEGICGGDDAPVGTRVER